MSDSRMKRASLVAFGVVGCLALHDAGQAQRASTKPYRGTTTAAPSEYSVSYRGQDNAPRNYGLYYQQARVGGGFVVPANAVYVVPPLPPPPPQPVVIGPVKKYSDEQYSQLINDLIAQDRESRALPTPPPAPEETPKPEPEAAPDAPAAVEHAAMTMAKATVTSVTDEGTIITHEAGELRLRGLMFPDINSVNEKEAAVAQANLHTLRERGIGKTIYYTTQEPMRDSKKRVMVIAHLQDGTEINRMLVESGLARVNQFDFEDKKEADKLLAAQADAEKNKRGVWGE